MDRLIPEAVQQIQKDLATLDHIENQQIQSLGRMKVQQVAEVKLRNTNDEAHEHDLLAKAYTYWQRKLADDLGAPVNPYSTLQTSSPINIPVIHP